MLGRKCESYATESRYQKHQSRIGFKGTDFGLWRLLLSQEGNTTITHCAHTTNTFGMWAK